MSLQRIDRSPDLKKLRDEGYDIEIRCGHLLVKNVPYSTSKKEIKTGTLVSKLKRSSMGTLVPGVQGKVPSSA